MSQLKFRPGCTPAQALKSLKVSLKVMERAEHNAVLWFAEIRSRQLYRQLGFSSMNQFAELELGFSRTRTGDYLRLAVKLDELPLLRGALASGQLGYSKAREIIKVATPASEAKWIKLAIESTRAQLRSRIQSVTEKARKRRLTPDVQLDMEMGTTGGQSSAAIRGPALNRGGQGFSSDHPVTATPPRSPATVLPVHFPQSATDPGTSSSDSAGSAGFEATATEIPVRVSLEMSPEQFARFEALTGKLQKLGRRTTGSGRTPMILDALAALVAEEAVGEAPDTIDTTTTSNITSCASSARRRAPGKDPKNARREKRTGPPAQIHIYKCPDCGKAAVRTSRGELPIKPSTFERLACDANIDEAGKPNTATIPPKTRRAVLARDRHRCQAPGCRHVHHLEVHHIVPRHLGGSNKMDNLITLCSGCHRVWHEKGGPPPGWKQSLAR